MVFFCICYSMTFLFLYVSKKKIFNLLKKIKGNKVECDREKK